MSERSVWASGLEVDGIIDSSEYSHVTNYPLQWEFISFEFCKERHIELHQCYLQFVEVDNLTNKVKQTSADFLLFTTVSFNIKDDFSVIG